MSQIITVALNLTPEGAVVLAGDHAPGTSTGVAFELTGIAAERREEGVYRVSGPGVAVPEGWRASIFRDENDELTVRLAIEQGPGYVEYRCTDPLTGIPKDIVNLLTVRVVVMLEAPEAVPADELDAVELVEDGPADA